MLIQLSILGHLSEWLLGLGGWPVLAFVFLLPALEASVFLGMFIPGETAVVIGGVVASQGRLSLGSCLAAAILGAVIGDSVGFWVGERWGERILARFTGRFLKQRQIEKAKAFLRQRRGWALVLGRYTAALRALIPGLAGMSRVPYRAFLFYNVLGGAGWAIAFTLLGYLAGSNWRRVARLGHWAGLAALAAVVLALLGLRLYRRRSERSKAAQSNPK